MYTNFVCQKCLQEHQHMLKKGYGYSYLGNVTNCYRHPNNQTSQNQNGNENKFQYKSRRFN